MQNAQSSAQIPLAAVLPAGLRALALANVRRLRASGQPQSQQRGQLRVCRGVQAPTHSIVEVPKVKPTRPGVLNIFSKREIRLRLRKPLRFGSTSSSLSGHGADSGSAPCPESDGVLLVITFGNASILALERIWG